MKSRIVACLFFFIALMTFHAHGADTGKTPLAGTWQGVEAVYDKEKVAGKDLQLTFTDSRVMILLAGNKDAFAYTVDVAKGHLDLAFSEGKDKGKKLPGIYKLEGDMLKICIGLATKAVADNTDRPKSFDAGSGIFYASLVRKK